MDSKDLMPDVGVGHARPGRVYEGDLYIEGGVGSNPEWCLTIHNDGWLSKDLELLEARLYCFGMDEGVLTAMSFADFQATGRNVDDLHSVPAIAGVLD